jgi:DNA-binding NarL/FixJ family response regulator
VTRFRVISFVASAAERSRVVDAIRAASDELELCAEFSNLTYLVNSDVPADVVVVEVGSEKDDRIRAVRRAYPAAVVIAIAPERNRKRLRAALAAGADGIVLRNRLYAIAGTVRAALAGQVVIPRELRTSIVKPSLSVREKQVLGMVVMGFSNGEIAGKLVLAESTIKSHLSSAFAKLGVRSRGEATELILDPVNGLGPGILSIAVTEEQLGPELTPEDAPTLARS